MNPLIKTVPPFNENLLSIEISCHHNDEMWNLSKQKIFDICMRSIKEDGLLNNNDVIDFKVVKVPNVYPIYRKDYDKNLTEVNIFLKKAKIGNDENPYLSHIELSTAEGDSF